MHSFSPRLKRTRSRDDVSTVALTFVLRWPTADGQHRSKIETASSAYIKKAVNKKKYALVAHGDKLSVFFFSVAIFLLSFVVDFFTTDCRDAGGHESAASIMF